MKFAFDDAGGRRPGPPHCSPARPRPAFPNRRDRSLAPRHSQARPQECEAELQKSICIPALSLQLWCYTVVTSNHLRRAPTVVATFRRSDLMPFRDRVRPAPHSQITVYTTTPSRPSSWPNKRTVK